MLSREKENLKTKIRSVQDVEIIEQLYFFILGMQTQQKISFNKRSNTRAIRRSLGGLNGAIT
ncbi:hypothetical protein [Sinanaerobacter chloroacetimidivorans]|jgi:hypothetical protein|uniref:Uncharacterized protein n=1 Tax=Sinanaerobacter chloroacetimidivorans TaxID=2818044 RepID=A0A8J7W2R2_9FIRM|nr:hypothetical protein [Sinanaerobacter chloroacetimidivorans]MBR0598036.1 hypothetical protein [Sinanaerobacter chloroacetimidivorans]